MQRVLKPGGRLAVSLWSDLQENPYFAAPEAARQGVVRDVIEEMAAYETKGAARIPFRSHLILARK